MNIYVVVADGMVIEAFTSSKLAEAAAANYEADGRFEIANVEVIELFE